MLLHLVLTHSFPWGVFLWSEPLFNFFLFNSHVKKEYCQTDYLSVLFSKTVFGYIDTYIYLQIAKLHSFPRQFPGTWLISLTHITAEE